jgi:hypothetical protein
MSALRACISHLINSLQLHGNSTFALARLNESDTSFQAGEATENDESFEQVEDEEVADGERKLKKVRLTIQ